MPIFFGVGGGDLLYRGPENGSFFFPIGLKFLTIVVKTKGTKHFGGRINGA